MCHTLNYNRKSSKTTCYDCDVCAETVGKDLAIILRIHLNYKSCLHEISKLQFK